MRYLMGERTAAFVRQEMERANGPKSVAAGASRRSPANAFEEDAFAHPFELRWAASAGEESGGRPKGAWIVWLPKGSLVLDGVEASTDDLTAANGYPDGWYDLTDIFGEADAPEEFDLYLDVGAKVKFTVERDSATNPVLIAQVKGKAVKGVVESALVAFGGAPFPWELRRFYDEPEEGTGGERVPVWRVWIPSAAITLISGSVAKKVVYDSGMTPGPDPSVSYQIEGGSSSAMWGSANYAGEIDEDRTLTAIGHGLAGVWASVSVPDGGGSVYLRVFSAAGDANSATVELTDVLPEGKDATVNHPVELTKEGFYIRVASVNADGVVTQCVRSMLSLTVIHGGIVQKMITGGTGISVQETEGRIHISATGGGDSGGGGSTGGGDGEDTGTGISGTVVVATAPRYDEGSHQLRYTPVSLTFANGRLTAMESGAETVIAQAVEESA